MVLSIAVGFSQRINGLRIRRRSKFQDGLSIPLQGTGATIRGYKSQVIARTISFIFL